MPTFPTLPSACQHPALRTLTALVSLACLHMAPAHAQNPAPQGAHAALPEVVVSGSRQEQAADDLPLSYDVINATTLSNQQSRTLREALQDLPNASVKRSPARFAVGGTTASAGRDGNVGINIRGLGGNRVLLMTDGVRMPRSYAFRTTTFDREYLSLELLKRIEIVRGPASALYGSDGMAGLVNFITHEPTDFLATKAGDAPKTLGGRIAAGWSGDDNGHTLAGTVAGKASDSLQWMLTATTRGAHAVDNMGTNDEPNLNRTRPNPQDDRDNAVLGKIVLRPHAARHAGADCGRHRGRVFLALDGAQSPDLGCPFRPGRELGRPCAHGDCRAASAVASGRHQRAQHPAPAGARQLLRRAHLEGRSAGRQDSAQRRLGAQDHLRAGPCAQRHHQPLHRPGPAAARSVSAQAFSRYARDHQRALRAGRIGAWRLEPDSGPAL